VAIETAGAEIGAALLSDTEYLLDHASEQRATVYDVLTRADWYSPAWALVTTYYWCFFSALAITRLTGRTAWFIDRSAVDRLRLLSGSSVQPPAGAMSFSLGAYVSATNRGMLLRPAKSQLHDAAWAKLAATVSDVFAHCDQNSDGLEYRMWWSLKRIADVWGADWASKVRNAANYRPGWAYREIVRAVRVDTMLDLRQSSPRSFGSLVEDLEDHATAVSQARPPAETLEEGSRLLGLCAQALTALSVGLHDELIARQGGDPRWRGLRESFLTARCETAAGDIWPFS